MNKPAASPTRSAWSDLIWVFALANGVFIIDQAAKYWAVVTLKNQPAITIIPGVFYFAYGENTGIAFGLFQNHGGWLHVITPLAFALLLYLIYKQFAEAGMDAWYRLIFGLLIGGAIGNIYDRMLNGYVVDFIDVYINTYHWPTFNMADSALCAGQALLVIKLLFFERGPEPASQPESSGAALESDPAATENKPPCTPS
ncbi:MAG: signal peptidase II [bacterium]|nr:signal peptidase II [bacterium]